VRDSLRLAVGPAVCVADRVGSRVAVALPAERDAVVDGEGGSTGAAVTLRDGAGIDGDADNDADPSERVEVGPDADALGAEGDSEPDGEAVRLSALGRSVGVGVTVPVMVPPVRDGVAVAVDGAEAVVDAVAADTV
jgi:hypothetical protein